MCCEDLVCARCAGPVVEARCPACRSARASLHHSTFTLTPQFLAIILAIVSILCILAAHRI
jgi:hypothetical protein